VGTSRGNYNLVNQIDLGPQTTYSFVNNLPEGNRIYVRVVPYNSWGVAEGCPEWSFTTRGKDVTAADLPIPKFFTPNNDGFNDTWTIAPGPELAVEHIRIFNRFGQLIKQLAADQAWDGNFNGRPMASDSYWYRIRTTDGKTLTGFLLLKR
jgi:gliding motility-associated-like protein